ncbi:MAG: ABC transporter substrate-binding protein [Fimbriimonadaceae bacterium]|nr:ABC transporter substrate-binding protein [Fimbriimonadaceae bacterium]
MCEDGGVSTLPKLGMPLIGIVVLAAFVASERVTAPPPQGDRVVVTYWEKWTGFEGDAMRAVVDEFNRSQNRIFVKMLSVAGIEDKTLFATAGGNPPDVAGLYGPNVAWYVDDGAILPLDDYCRKFGIKEEDYIPIYWDICSIRGGLYALPTTPASTALHYNKRLFRQAGLDPEKPPETIEQMDAMAEKLTKRDASGRVVQSGFLPAEPGWWNWGWGFVFGGKLWDGKDKITANSPENVRAFEWVQGYSKRYGASDLQSFRSGFGNFASPQNAFLAEKVAMELQGVWMFNFISQFAPKLEWAAVPFPHPADRPDLSGLTFADLDILVIPRGAKHPDEAFEFIRYVQSQKAMEMLCLGQRKHSPLRKVSDHFWQTSKNPNIRLFAELPGKVAVVSPPKLAIWPEYSAELNAAFDEIALMRKTPKEALDYVQVRVQAKLDDYLMRQQAREGNR